MNQASDPRPGIAMPTLRNKDIKDFKLATTEYQVIVNACAQYDIPIEIPNRHIDHAAVLENNIFRRSVRNVDVLTGNIPELFFEKISAKLDLALSRGVKVRMIVVNGGPCCDGVETIKSKYPNFQVLAIKPQMRPTVQKEMEHFVVSDGKRYRLEEHHDPNKDFSVDPEINAVACFNDPEAAKSLHEAFDALISSCEPIN